MLYNALFLSIMEKDSLEISHGFMEKIDKDSLDVDSVLAEGMNSLHSDGGNEISDGGGRSHSNYANGQTIEFSIDDIEDRFTRKDAVLGFWYNQVRLQ